MFLLRYVISFKKKKNKPVRVKALKQIDLFGVKLFEMVRTKSLGVFSRLAAD